MQNQMILFIVEKKTCMVVVSATFFDISRLTCFIADVVSVVTAVLVVVAVKAVFL